MNEPAKKVLDMAGEIGQGFSAEIPAQEQNEIMAGLKVMDVVAKMSIAKSLGEIATYLGERGS